MPSTWIETPLRSRFGAPVRAGTWSAAVVGTNPIEPDQEVWLEVIAGETDLGRLPGYWLENQGVNSLWHVPVPPQPMGMRLKYRAGMNRAGSEPTYSGVQEVVVRPNPPPPAESPALSPRPPEGLVGNRQMTALVDGRAATYDVYFPTVGLHSDVRPASGDDPRSRVHFRAILGGLAAGFRIDWFCERTAWDARQSYQEGTNLLVTELRWRDGPIRVVVTDGVAAGPGLPRTAGGGASPGQYLKRFRIINDGDRPLVGSTFAVHVHTEINGGLGETGLSWHDGESALVAVNRGHAHTNRKLARDATVEFAVAFDGRGPAQCEPIGPSEAMLLRALEVPAGGSVTVDLIVSGAFTGWKGDVGTFDHQLRPALAWFRAADLDAVERESGRFWTEFLGPLPEPDFPGAAPYAEVFRRTALAAALHADADWGAVAGGYERGIMAYGWPRDVMALGCAFGRLGQAAVFREAIQWLARVGAKVRPYSYWFEKYSIDGWAEWETPSLDQSALVPWAVERYYRQTGDLAAVGSWWPMVEQAAAVCMGRSGHPGLSWCEPLSLLVSAGLWDRRYAGFLYGNACAVAGLQAAARLAEALDKSGSDAPAWRERAGAIWERGILGPSAPGPEPGPGLLDPQAGRFLEARHLSTLRGLWTERPERLVDRSAALDVGVLALAVPLGLLPPDDGRLRASAEAILKHNRVEGDPSMLARLAPDPLPSPDACSNQGPGRRQPWSSQATLWMARYLLRLGRETGDGSLWARAVALLDGVIDRLGPLGVGLHSGPRGAARGARCTLPGVNELHVPLLETLLELAGLEYDAPGRRLALDPVLPPSWPHVGLGQRLPCGTVRFRLERPVGRSTYRLLLQGELEHAVQAEVGVTCPGLAALGNWAASTKSPDPRFDPARARLAWSVRLPAGKARREWSWG